MLTHYKRDFYLLEKLSYEWLHLECFESSHQSIRDAQEEVHLKNSHWG